MTDVPIDEMTLVATRSIERYIEPMRDSGGDPRVIIDPLFTAWSSAEVYSVAILTDDVSWPRVDNYRAGITAMWLNVRRPEHAMGLEVLTAPYFVAAETSDELLEGPVVRFRYAHRGESTVLQADLPIPDGKRILPAEMTWFPDVGNGPEAQAQMMVLMLHDIVNGDHIVAPTTETMTQLNLATSEVTAA